MNNNGAQLKTSAPRFQFSVSSFSVFQLPAVLSQQQTTAANGKKTLAIYLQRITWHVKHFIARIFQSHTHRRAHLKCSLMQQKFLLFYQKKTPDRGKNNEKVLHI